jgi:N-formylglutamate deformylase
MSQPGAALRCGIMTEPFLFHRGETPLLVSLPHDSPHIPGPLAARMTPAALQVADTDWHVGKLYDFAAGLGASVLCATHSRYVVDLNRDPAGGVLYPGADNTEIVPITTFEREPIYRPGEEPDADEIAGRVETYWNPYHARLAEALAELRARFGTAVLFDGHTIKSEVPRFFEGRVADLNIGTAEGAAADDGLRRTVHRLLDASPYDTVLDDRFTGGYITRHYGRPAEGVNAVQLELTWRCYMDEAPPFTYLPDRAAGLKAVLRPMLEAMRDWAMARSSMAG